MRRSVTIKEINWWINIFFSKNKVVFDKKLGFFSNHDVHFNCKKKRLHLFKTKSSLLNDVVVALLKTQHL